MREEKNRRDKTREEKMRIDQTRLEKKRKDENRREKKIDDRKDDSIKKPLEINGWIENENEKYSNIPKVCPKCGSELWKTDALQTCGIYWIGCKNLKCRWSEEFIE